MKQFEMKIWVIQSSFKIDWFSFFYFFYFERPI